ncbi:hypothetical protein NCS52_00187300 [Fusarium sp. LHS14.1]|nr:hypothetical protein NCS52_00187300 [Fusarium sp. LHS14.1]
MAFTSTRPSDAWRPSAMHVYEFQAAIAEACRNYYGDSSRDKLYNKMRVLAFHWEADGDTGLKRSYGYAVERLSIQGRDSDPGATLSFNLTRLLDGLAEDDLAIVYYIGHGKQHVQDRGPRLMLEPSQPPGAPSVPAQQIDFQEVRTRLIDPSPANVLILLDCCYAAGGGIGHRKELIAASAFDSVTRGGPDSFTSILIQQLQHAIDNRHILSTAQLYNRMATMHLVRPKGKPQLYAMPFYLQNPDEGRMPIMLAPNMGHEDWTPGAVLPLFQSPVNVVLHVHLRDANAETLSQVKQWLLVNRPHNIDRVEIKDVFPSLSMVFIIRITLDVWYSLRDHPAISFIGFELNDNPATKNPPVLQAMQSKNTFGTTPKGSSASNQKENQPFTLF